MYRVLLVYSSKQNWNQPPILVNSAQQNFLEICSVFLKLLH